MLSKKQKIGLFILFVSLFCVFFLYVNISAPPENKNDKKQIKTAIARGKTFLKNIQTAEGAICDTVNPLFNVWETVLAAKALYAIDQDTTDVVFAKALQYLRKSENTDGLVCHNLKCKANYCIETSALYLALLADLVGKEKIQNRLQKIAQLQQKQGNWLVGNPDVREKRDFPTATAFALNVLQKTETPILYPKEALQWLVGKQREDGHWGYTWEYYDLPAYALWAISETISKIQTPEIQVVKSKAIHYIIKSQQQDGSWEYGGTSHFKTPSKELEVAIMLASIQNFLAQEKNPDLERTAQKALQFLLKRQTKKGAWEGGFFPINSMRYEKKEYIFATAMAIAVLQKHLDQNHKKD